MKTIYLAAGCFWGTEAFFKQMKGVEETTCGYANGNTKNPAYEDLKHGLATHAEAVKVIYDETKIDLEKILDYYLSIIDPYSVNHQGEDKGLQYRTGVYWKDESLKADILSFFKKREQEMGDKPFAIELQPLVNFYDAEDYHQDYLDKHKDGYCHINLNSIRKEDKK